MKIIKLLEEVIKEQKEIKEEMKDLNINIIKNKIKIEQNIDDCCISISNLANTVCNVYTKDETLKAIDEEIQYNADIRKCQRENQDLLDLINIYCKFSDKYEVIDLYNELNSKFLIKRK